MLGYFISLGFWMLCLGLMMLYWRRQFDRQSRERAAIHEQKMEEWRKQDEQRQAQRDAENIAAAARHGIRMLKIEARRKRLNQFLIQRGMEPLSPPEYEDDAT